MKKHFFSLVCKQYAFCAGLLFAVSVFPHAGNAADKIKEADANDFKVMILHGPSGKHSGEFDVPLKELGWLSKKYAATMKNMDRLAGVSAAGSPALDLLAPDSFEQAGEKETPEAELFQYDMILGCPLLNLGTKDGVDMKPYFKVFRSFVEKGGALVLTDALYPHCYRWLAFIDPGLTFEMQGNCRAKIAPSDTDPVSPFRYLPNTKRDYNSWGHLVLPKKNSAWEVVLRCGEGYPVTLVKRMGKGYIYLTALRQPNKETLETLRANLEFQRLGLAVTKFSMPEFHLGDGSLEITMKNTGAAPLSLKGNLFVTPPEGKGLSFSADCRIPGKGEGTLSVPYTNGMRGKLNVKFVVSTQKKQAVAFDRKVVLPELLTILPPRYRSLALESELKKHGVLQIGYAIAPCGEDTKHLTVKTCVKTADGKSVGRSDERRVTELQTRFPFSAGALTPGEYKIVSRIFENGVLKEKKESRFRVLKESECITFLNDDMNLVVNGKPFFPVGLYHISPDDLKQYGKELGINMIQLMSWNPKGVEIAEELGIKVLWEQNHRQPGNIEKIITTNTVPRNGGRGPRLIDHPNIIAWYGRDEPYEADLESAAQLTEAFHRADLRRPTYMVSCTTRLFEASAKTADLFAPDPYPYSKSGDSILKVAEWMDLAWNATKGDKPVICVLQCFGVETEGPFRAMAYLALTHEARGLLWYPWDDGKSDKNPRGGSGLKYNPELQTVFKDVAAQVKILSPALLNKEGRKQFKSADGKIHGMRCQEKTGKRYLLVVNPHSEENTIDLKNSAGIKSSSILSNLFDNEQVNGKDPLIMKPYETKAYTY